MSSGALRDNSQMVQKSALFNPAVTSQIQPVQQAPVVDTSNAIGSLAEMLGPTPAEREAKERRLQKDRAQMQAWAGMFDGLRQLGNLYYTAKGAPSQQLQAPYQQLDNVYEQERQRNLQLDDYRSQYQQQLYNLNRQIDQDQIQREAHQANIQYKKSQEEALMDKSRREDEKNQAMIKRADAMAVGDHYKAAYWKAKSEGYADEAAARIAKAESEKARNEAAAELSRVRAKAGGFAPSRNTGKASGNGGRTGSKTNKSGFFGKGK